MSEELNVIEKHFNLQINENNKDFITSPSTYPSLQYFITQCNLIDFALFEADDITKYSLKVVGKDKNIKMFELYFYYYYQMIKIKEEKEKELSNSKKIIEGISKI